MEVPSNFPVKPERIPCFCRPFLSSGKLFIKDPRYFIFRMHFIIFSFFPQLRSVSESCVNHTYFQFSANRSILLSFQLPGNFIITQLSPFSFLYPVGKTFHQKLSRILLTVPCFCFHASFLRKKLPPPSVQDTACSSLFLLPRLIPRKKLSPPSVQGAAAGSPFLSHADNSARILNLYSFIYAVVNDTSSRSSPWQPTVFTRKSIRARTAFSGAFSVIP